MEEQTTKKNAKYSFGAGVALYFFFAALSLILIKAFRC